MTGPVSGFVAGGLLAAVLVSACAGPAREAEPIRIEEVGPPPDPGPPRIQRAVLADVLSRGPGRFLERMPVVPERSGKTFLGYKVLELYGRTPPHPRGLRPGDVVVTVNGIAVSRPEHLMRVWDGLKAADAIDVDVLRDGGRERITYLIVD